MSSPNNPSREIAAIDKRIGRKVGRQIITGVAEVVTPDGRSARVRLAGSNTLTDVAIMRSATVSPGDTVVLVRPIGSEIWICLGAFFRRIVNALGITTQLGTPGLAPPNGITALGESGMLVCYWEVPPQRPDLTFHVQVTDITDSTWESAVTYRRGGSYLLLFVDPGTQKKFRVRSVDSEWNKSGWSPTVQATATGFIETGNEANLPATPIGEYFAIDTDILYIGDGTTWHALAGSGVTGVGGADTFLELTDTPASYSGQSLKYTRVNAGETGLEFAAAAISFSGVRTYLVEAQSLVGSGFYVYWDGEEYDTDNYHDLTTNKERIVAPKSGYYLITATLVFAPVEVETYMGFEIVGSLSNFNPIFGRIGHSEQYSNNFVNGSGVVYLEEGEYITVYAFHGYYGATLLVGEGYNTLSMTYLGA